VGRETLDLFLALRGIKVNKFLVRDCIIKLNMKILRIILIIFTLLSFVSENSNSQIVQFADVSAVAGVQGIELTGEVQ